MTLTLPWKPLIRGSFLPSRIAAEHTPKSTEIGTWARYDEERPVLVPHDGALRLVHRRVLVEQRRRDAQINSRRRTLALL